jgi:hypothetical protein
MKKMKRIIFFAALIFLFASCEREMAFDVISETEPSLTVVAETKTVDGTTTTYTKINGATIKVYNTKEAFDANGVAFLTKTTGSDGKAVFSKTELATKGIFYVRAESGILTGKGTTPYILLNDGNTFLFIELI